MDVDVAILGAGAAGLICAGEAARRGRRVVVIEHRAAPGEKIRISGGGRCNFTNLGTLPARFLSANPRFAISALARFTPADFVARVDRAGIAWHEKAAGQLFCTGSAMQIVRMLVDGLAQAQLWTGTSFSDLRYEDQVFAITTSRGVLRAGRVVVATGGKSVPKAGATDAGYRIAAAFGVPVVETRPGLVPLTFAAQELDWLRPLSGTSVDARVSVDGAGGRAAFGEPLLFTHRGLSGPAVLQVSNYWREGDAVTLDLAPGRESAAQLRAQRGRHGRIGVAAALAQVLPERLARTVADRAGVAGNLAEQTNASIDRLAGFVHAMRLKPVGTEGYRTAEVTLGGVDTAALDPRTMAVRKVPGLYFVGEVVDVTGWLGGYNFQWAWSSGWAAGQDV